MTISSARSSFRLRRSASPSRAKVAELRRHVALGGENNGGGKVAHRPGASNLEAVETGKAFAFDTLQIVHVFLGLVGRQLIFGIVGTVRPSGSCRRFWALLMRALKDRSR